jgi:shikimate kinase
VTAELKEEFLGQDRRNTAKVGPDTNLVLIGMPGVGKSTVGVLLAKATSRDFLDTDVLIQAKEGRTLQEIIDGEGVKAFCRREECHVLSLACRSCVIATGGSVVYRAASMRHLGSFGIIIHLDLNLSALEKRLTDLKSRGVVMAPGQALFQLFAERQPLYRRYAQHTIRCDNRTHEEIVDDIIRRLGGKETLEKVRHPE